jgi:hypothetical protein
MINSRRRLVRDYETPPEVMTTQVCFIVILVLMAGAVVGTVVGLGYVLLKGTYIVNSLGDK